jgi:cyclopropane fatty-acyl-phospholipid synthase-like methyltransferase
MTALYILAPYVATPPDVVKRMLQLANVRSDDVVFDLGCGDGRLAIAAAATAGARGVGVDIEPYWVEQATANARLAGVSGLTRFEHQDALSVDLTSATVVFLYLVHWSTQMVMSRILAQVAEGTRIVSHSFPIEPIAPERTESFIDESGRTCSLYLSVAGITPGSSQKGKDA